MKVILAVICTTWAVVKIRPEKIQACTGFEPRCSALPTELTSQLTARITFIHVFIRSSNIRLSYILNCLIVMNEANGRKSMTVCELRIME